MRPRPRVTRALWVVAGLTVALWAAYAVTGMKYQINESHGTAHIALSMFQMAWPFIAVIFMGVIAKFNEVPTAGDWNAPQPPQNEPKP